MEEKDAVYISIKVIVLYLYDKDVCDVHNAIVGNA
jgi:hypothetical protein